MPTFQHCPVLLDAVVHLLTQAPGCTLLDCTLGGGGHTEALLKAGANVIGLDQDTDAIAEVTHRLSWASNRLRIVHSNFREFGNVLDELGVHTVDGILLDLGVSSFQLDTPSRGFSFKGEGPLDMRMDQTGRITQTSAAEILQTASKEELVRIFRTYGEEPHAGKIATAILKARESAPITTTSELAALVERVVYQPHFKKGKHPATRVFQALRLAVNDELGALHTALESAITHLNPKGRLVVITFHSLEDRIVKNFSKETTAPTLDRPEWPQPKPNPRHYFRYLEGHRKPIEASQAEVDANPRARSAKLRVLERL